MSALSRVGSGRMRRAATWGVLLVLAVLVGVAPAHGASTLVYDGGGSQAFIQSALNSLGVAFDLRTPTNPVTAADLASHDLLVVGWNLYEPMSGISASVLAAGITGNILVTGHDPDYHAVSNTGSSQASARLFLSQAMTFARSGGGTGLVALADAYGGFSYLPPEWGITAPHNEQDAVASITAAGAASGVYQGLTATSMSGWGSSCHDTLTATSPAFQVFELDPSGQAITIATPEPATLALLALGGAAVIIRRRRAGALALCKRVIRKGASARTGLIALALILAAAGTAAAAPTAALVGTYNSSSWGVWLLGISAGDNDGVASLIFQVGGTTSVNFNTAPKADSFIGDGSGVIAGTFGFSGEHSNNPISANVYDFRASITPGDLESNAPYLLRHMGQQVVDYTITNDDGTTRVRHIPPSSSISLTVPPNDQGVAPGNYPNSFQVARGAVQAGHVPYFVVYPAGVFVGINCIALGEDFDYQVPPENVTAVFMPSPEPATLSLLALGGAAALVRRRRRSAECGVRGAE